MTSIDIRLFFEHYEVWDIDYLSGYKFAGQTGIFKRYIEQLVSRQKLVRYKSTKPLNQYSNEWMPQMTFKKYNGTMSVKCGGLNDRVREQLSWEQFNIGYETNEALRPLNRLMYFITGNTKYIGRKFRDYQLKV